jgi:hypothetical protein
MAALCFSVINHENKPPGEEWINSPYLSKEAQEMLL